MPRLTGRHNGTPGSHPHPQVAILLQVTILYTELIKATDVPSNKIAARHKKIEADTWTDMFKNT